MRLRSRAQKLATISTLRRVFIAALRAFQEARPIVQLAFALRFAVGGLFMYCQPGIHPLVVNRVVLGHLAWACAAWFVYLANGLADITEDRANHSHRPIAAGTLSTRAATTMCAALLCLSLGIGVFVSLWFEITVAAMVILGILYSAGRHPTKEIPGLSLITAGGGILLTYIAGALAYGDAVSVPPLVFGFVMALWTSTAGNTKDLSDVEGDSQSGRSTLPILLGFRGSSQAIVAGSVFVSLGGTLAVMASTEDSSLMELLPATLLLAFSLRDINPQQTPHERRRPYRVFMASQFIVNLSSATVCLLLSPLTTGS